MRDYVESDIIDMKDHQLPANTEDNDAHAIRFILQCRNEAKLAKWNTIQQTRENYDIFWGRHDFAHKKPGQSRETLAMQPMAVEQTAAFFQQALVDMGDAWWRVGAKNPRNESHLKVSPELIQAITQQQITKANILRHVGLGLKSGLLGGKIITKVHGCWEPIPVYMAERSGKGKKTLLKRAQKKAWRLKLDLVSQFNYYPDPTPAQVKLYEIEDMWVDFHEMLEYAQGDDAIYDYDTCMEVSRRSDDDAEEKFDLMRRTNQNETSHGFRSRVKLTEFWGTLLDINGEVLHENCVATLANDRWLIRKPQPNPLWHQESPYVEGDLLDSPDSTWPRALASAGTKYNIAANELFNLMLDGALRAVNGVAQIRQDWLEDPAQAEGGVVPGTTFAMNSQAPPGAKVYEQLSTGQVPPDSLQLYNLLNQEFNRAMLTSDIRQGMTPRKDVSATQVVEANQTITSVFSGMSKQIEQRWMQKLLEKSWMTCAQFSDDIDEQEIRALLEPQEADAFLKLSAEERFAATVGAVAFDVFGISLQLQKAQDFKKVMTLLQTIGGSEPLTEAFVKRFSFDETLAFAMRSLGLPIKQLEISADEQAMMKGPPQGGQAQGPQGGGPQGQPAAPSLPGAAPNGMSQVPSPNNGSLADQLGSAAPPQFPHQGFAPKGGQQ